MFRKYATVEAFWLYLQEENNNFKQLQKLWNLKLNEVAWSASGFCQFSKKLLGDQIYFFIVWPLNMFAVPPSFRRTFLCLGAAVDASSEAIKASKRTLVNLVTHISGRRAHSPLMCWSSSFHRSWRNRRTRPKLMTTPEPQHSGLNDLLQMFLCSHRSAIHPVSRKAGGSLPQAPQQRHRPLRLPEHPMRLRLLVPHRPRYQPSAVLGPVEQC